MVYDSVQRTAPVPAAGCGIVRRHVPFDTILALYREIMESLEAEDEA